MPCFVAELGCLYGLFQAIVVLAAMLVGWDKACSRYAAVYGVQAGSVAGLLPDAKAAVA